MIAAPSPLPSQSQSQSLPPGSRRHLLSIVVEEPFQGTALNHLVPASHWSRFESRVVANTERALALLDAHGARATFFVLGWIAERLPELVRTIVDRGYEVASKGYHHFPLEQLTREQFRDEVVRSRDAIERASGQRCLGFRLPRGALRAEDAWVLEVLAEEGFVYDSSCYPRLRSIAGAPHRRYRHREQTAAGPIEEFPLSTLKVAGLHLPFGGGNYFRQLPDAWVRRLVARLDRVQQEPLVLYFHTWELDPQSPRIAAGSWFTRVRQYRNVGKLEQTLPDLLDRYRFIGFRDWLERAAEPAPARERALSGWSRRPDVAPADDALPVTLLVPCFNEEPVLGYLRNTLDDLQRQLADRYAFRYVFVDDGSKDGTFAELERLFGARSDCTLVRHPANRGVAAAVVTAARHARTEVVASIDCDCTYDPHQLGSMIPLLTEGVAAVTASPYHEQGRVHNVPPWRLFLSRTLSALYRRVLRHPLATWTSCFRVYRREALLSAAPDDPGFLGVAEILGRLLRGGARVAECPAVLEVRLLGRSKMKIAKTIVGHLRLLRRLARLAPAAALRPMNDTQAPVRAADAALDPLRGMS